MQREQKQSNLEWAHFLQLLPLSQHHLDTSTSFLKFPCVTNKKSLIIILSLYLGFPDSSVGKESTYNAGDPGSIPGLGRSTGEGIGYPLDYSWASLVAQLIKNLPAMWETWVPSLVGKVPWRRERLPTPIFWPGEFHWLYSPCGRKGSDATELTLISSHFSRFT